MATAPPPQPTFPNVPRNWSAYTKLVVPEGGGKGGTVRIHFSDNSFWFIKGGQGSAARVLFAEALLKRYGKAHTPESRVIRKNDPEFRQLVTILRGVFVTKKQDLNRRTDLTREQKQEEDKILDVRMNSYVNADYLVVMKPAVGIEMAELIDPRSSGKHLLFLQDCLYDDNFLRGIGKILAVDTLLGNNDRFESVNAGNAFINKWTREISVIDNDAILPSFQTNTTYNSNLIMNQAHELSRENWAADIVSGTASTPASIDANAQPEMMSELSSVMRPDFNFEDRLWGAIEKHNREDSYEHMSKERLQLVQDLRGMADWDTIRTRVIEGMRQAIREMSGTTFGFETLKAEFRGLLAAHGGTDNNIQNGLFDLDALRIRMKYMQAMSNGAARSAALQQVQTFAAGRGLQAKELIDPLERRAATFHGKLHQLTGIFAKAKGNDRRADRHEDIETFRSGSLNTAVMNEVSTRELLRKYIQSPADIPGLGDHQCKVVATGAARLAQIGLEKRIRKIQDLISDPNFYRDPAARRIVCATVLANGRTAVATGRRYVHLLDQLDSGQTTLKMQLTASISSLDRLLPTIEANGR